MAQSRHIVQRLGTGLVLIAFCAVLLLISDAKRVPALSGRLPRVAVFQYSSQPMLDEGMRGLLDALRDHGYIDGQTMRLERFNAENDMPTAASIARELTGGRFEYVFTLSTNCLQAVAKANRDGRVKHVFGVVADPVGAGVGISASDPLDHPRKMVGVGTLAPIEELLATAKRMNPRLRRVGLPWNPSQSNSETYTKMARAAAPSLGLEVLEGTVDSTPAVGEVTASLVSRGAEALLVTGDLTVALAIDAVVAEARRGGIPVLATQPLLAARGVLLAIGGDYYLMGRDAGDVAARVLNGEDMSRMPILYRLPKLVTINRASAAGLRQVWVFPPDVLAQVRQPVSAVTVAAAAPLKKWNVSVLQFADSPVYDECRQGILAGFRDSGLVEGRDYQLTWRSAHGDMPTLNNLVDAGLTAGADMLYTLSTPALQVALQKVHDRPVLYALSLDPLLIGDRGTHSNHRANIAGIYSRSPFEAMMDLIHEALPHARIIGTLFTPSEANSLNHRDELEKAAQKAGLQLRSLPTYSASDVPDAAVALVEQGVDAVCQINDSLHSAAFPSIVSAARQSRVPVFSFLSSQASQGATLVLANDHFDGGRESALLAAQVIRGISPAKLPYQPVKKVRLIANPDAAKMIGFRIPEQVLARAEICSPHATGAASR
jgi:putative tryptophan/tyrosine transport system substrate-binding protein